MFSARVFAFLLVTQIFCGQAFSDDLIGVDWGGDAPTNWNVGTAGANTQELTNLINESGDETAISLAYDGLSFADTSFNRGFDNANPLQIPTHSNPLNAIGGGLGDGREITFTYSGLTTNTDYEIYLFGGKSSLIDTNHVVTGDINFTQDLATANTGDVWVNGSVGSNADLSDFAVIATSDNKGEISFNVAASGIVIAGLAIRPTPIIGDVNCDGEVDFSDIALFIEILANEGYSLRADINGDETVDFSDVAPFIGLLSAS